MHRVRRSVLVRSFLLPFALLLWLSACHKWVQLEPPVDRAIVQEKPGTVRLTLADTSQIVLVDPGVKGDSLIGTLPETGWMRKDPQTVAVNLQDVQEIHERRTKVAATIGLTLGAMVVALAAVIGMYCAIEGGCSMSMNMASPY
jgi:hypothetical protein